MHFFSPFIYLFLFAVALHVLTVSVAMCGVDTLVRSHICVMGVEPPSLTTVSWPTMPRPTAMGNHPPCLHHLVVLHDVRSFCTNAETNLKGTSLHVSSVLKDIVSHFFY